MFSHRSLCFPNDFLLLLILKKLNVNFPYSLTMLMLALNRFSEDTKGRSLKSLLGSQSSE